MRLILALLLGGISIGICSVHAAPANDKIASFHTPSLNIGCIEYSGQLRCDIGQKSWQARATSCQLDSGDSFTMHRRGRPVWTCHGDTALHMGRVLPYGSTWRRDAFTCTSRVDGLTCTNAQKHGFFLSKQSYRVF